MKKYRPLFYTVFCLLAAFLITGCAVTGTGGKDDTGAKTGGKDNPATGGDPQTTQVQPGGEKIEVVLYFADSDSEALVPETRQIVKVPGMAKATVNELLKGPASGSKLQGTVPKGTKLLDLNIKNGQCTLNFSKEIQTNHGGGSTGEMMTIYSIVNTLTQFESILTVKFMVEGEAVETLVGHADLSAPVTRNDALLKP